MDSLNCSSLPVACHTAPLHPGTIPVNRVVRLMGMNCNAVLWVSMLYRLLVLTETHLERPLGLPDVGLMAFFTWNLVDHSSLLLFRNAGLDSHQGLPEGPGWLEDCLDPKGSAYPLQLLAESLNIGEAHDPQWVLTRRFRGGKGRSGMGSTGECLLHQVLGEAIGLENTLEVLEFRLS